MTLAGAPAIVVRGLHKRYHGRPAIDGLDLEVAAGSVVALLGPNGAGKTTTVEILEGYRRADSGDVRVLGLDPAADGPSLRSRVGLMLQGGGIYPQATPREIARLYARFYREPLDPDGLIEKVGLADAASTRYRVLSGGQRQRLALALALVGRPELVILDEPTAGMDPAAKAATRELIGSLRGDGVSVLLTTHELADAERLADRIAIVVRGRVVADGTLAELAAGATPAVRFGLGSGLAPADRTALESALRAATTGSADPRLIDDGGVGRYRIVGSAPSPGLLAALAGWCHERGLLIDELRTAGTSLEERYLELVGPEAGDGAAGRDGAEGR